jgi:hypothetical protein
MKRRLSEDHQPERASWLAMLRFANHEPLTAQEWDALSWITLVDKTQFAFERDNVRWATSDAERADNLAFYRSLSPVVH